MSLASQISQANDGARILWQWFQSPNDSEAKEGHVREFNKESTYVRISPTHFKEDAGDWLRISDLRLVSVLQEHVTVIERPKATRPSKGKPCSGEETGGLDL